MLHWLWVLAIMMCVWSILWVVGRWMSRCRHEGVYPGRDMYSHKYYFICCRCRKVKIPPSEKWLADKEAEKALAP